MFGQKKRKKYPLRQWMEEHNLEVEDMLPAWKAGMFYGLSTGIRTTPVSQMVKINNTYFAWVVIEES